MLDRVDGSMITLSGGNTLQSEFDKRAVSLKKFGAKGDWNGTTGTDDTAAIQAAIDACAPFEWQGSVSATKAYMGNVVSKITVPAGRYRITAPIKLNPFVIIEGPSKGGFYGQKTSFVADFTDLQGAIFDAAPYDTTGTRRLGWVTNRVDWDNGLSTGCPGWVLRNINIEVASGRRIRTGVNRLMAAQSVIENCGIVRGSGELFVGIRTSVTWSGAIRDNHIVANMYALENDSDVTVDKQDNNYLTVSGTKPNSTDFPTQWPEATNQYKSACIYNRYADPHIYDNTCEGAEVGIKASYSTYLRESGNYYEAISDTVYVTNSINVDVKPKWIVCAAAKLLDARGGSTVNVDLSSTSYFSVAGIGFIESFIKAVNVKGDYIGNLYNSKVNYLDDRNKQTVTIYLSQTGDDANHGYTSAAPVLTLQAALERCHLDKNNVFVIPANHVITTTYQYSDGTKAWLKQMPNLKVTVQGGTGSQITFGNSFSEIHSFPVDMSYLKVTTTKLKLASVTGDYRPAIIAGADTHVRLESLIVEGPGVLFGVTYGAVGNLKISLKDVTLTDTTFTHRATTGRVSWVEQGVGAVIGGTTAVGDITGRIMSSTFP